MTGCTKKFPLKSPPSLSNIHIYTFRGPFFWYGSDFNFYGTLYNPAYLDFLHLPTRRQAVSKCRLSKPRLYIVYVKCPVKV